MLWFRKSKPQSDINDVIADCMRQLPGLLERLGDKKVRMMEIEDEARCRAFIASLYQSEGQLFNNIDVNISSWHICYDLARKLVQVYHEFLNERANREQVEHTYSMKIIDLEEHIRVLIRQQENR